MKSRALLASVGMAISGVLSFGTIAMGADGVDLAPKFKKDDKVTFVQHTVRTNTMSLGGVPKPAEAKPEGEKPADKPGEKAPGGDKPADAPNQDAAKPAGSAAQPSSGGMTSTDSVDQTATYELRVVEAGEKGVQLELELKAIKATAVVPQGQFNWDSAQPRDDSEVNNPIAMSYRPILNAVTKITVDASGNISNVTPDPRVNLNPRGPLAPMVQALVGPELVRVRFANVLSIKDGKEPAKVGDSWKNVDELSAAAVGRFVLTTNNTLKSVNGDMAMLDIAGDVALAPGADGKPAQGTLREQALKGKAEWDVKSGWMKSHTIEQKQVLELNAAGFAVTRSTNMTVTTTRQ